MEFTKMNIENGKEWDISSYPSDGWYDVNGILYVVSDNMVFMVNNIDRLPPLPIKQSDTNEDLLLNVLSVALHQKKL